jgi:hypothetical protein
MGPLLPLLIFFSLLLPPLTFAAERRVAAEFSAVVTRTIPGEPDSVSQGKMTVSRYGIRTEGVKESRPMVVIFRPKKKIIWTLFPDTKQYEERLGLVVNRPPLPNSPQSPCQQDEMVLCQLLGRVTFNGRLVDHWLLSRKTPEKIQPIVQLWVDQKLQVTLQEKFIDGTTIRLSQIKEKVQSIKSFRVPANYRKIILKKPQSPSQPKDT